jgi:hypothetical protein
MTNPDERVTVNIRNEIDNFSAEVDRPILHWLFDRYHWRSKWNFVANCTFQRYGTYSYQTNRVWSPTVEGRVLYEHMRCVSNDGGE